jgi:osmotically-inducible protein OsmY
MATADTIRNVLLADPALASAARDMRISVLNGQITMTGRVVTQHDRERLHSAIAGIPGAYRVDDRVQVELNR